MKSRGMFGTIVVGLSLVCSLVLAGWLNPVVTNRADGSQWEFTNDVPCYLSSFYVDLNTAVSNTVFVNLVKTNGVVSTNELSSTTRTSYPSLVFMPDSEKSLFMEIGDLLTYSNQANEGMVITINRNEAE